MDNAGMTILYLTPPSLFLLALAAHFYRRDRYLLAGLCIALIALLALPRAFVARVVSIALVAGGLVWIETAYTIAMFRVDMGQPWLRLVLILGGVALGSVLSALMFRTARLRARYSVK
jgi:hypothetical protein